MLALINKNVLTLDLNISRVAECLMLFANWFQRVGPEMGKALAP